MSASIIAIVNQKGGTGKTTTTVNLGAALALAGKRVMLLDLDPQGNLSYYLGLQDFQYTADHVLTGQVKLADALHETERMQVLPGDIELADLELSLAGVDNREQLLKQVLDSVANDYDYILIDCGPSLSLLTINALTAANKVLIPLQPEVLSLQGLSLIMDTVFNMKEELNPDLTIIGVLPVIVDFRRGVTHEVMAVLKENFGLYIFESVIKVDSKAIESPSFGVSIMEYAPDSPSAKGYMLAAGELMGICGN